MEIHWWNGCWRQCRTYTTLHMRQRKNKSGWNYRKHAIRFRSDEHWLTKLKSDSNDSDAATGTRIYLEALAAHRKWKRKVIGCLFVAAAVAASHATCQTWKASDTENDELIFIIRFVGGAWILLNLEPVASFPFWCDGFSLIAFAFHSDDRRNELKLGSAHSLNSDSFFFFLVALAVVFASLSNDQHHPERSPHIHTHRMAMSNF